ncbi:MAG: (Fe-S)-binding protein, partial [Bacteroidia bacterium]|nr:(Fe-S)-binding protein [Bacteroidia bacterium]
MQQTIGSMTVELFVTCLIDQFYPETGMNMIKVLEKAGAKVHYNGAQTCCGKTAFINGYWDEAKQIGEHFILTFDTENYVVGPSGSCVAFVRDHYDKLFYNSGLHLEFKRLKNRIFELSDFLVTVLKCDDLGAELKEKAVLHDSVSAHDRQRAYNSPVQLLQHVRGLELLPWEDQNSSCGYQGIGPGQISALAEALLKTECEKIISLGASVMITTDTTCLLNFDTYIRKNDLPLRVLHLA